MYMNMYIRFASAEGVSGCDCNVEIPLESRVSDLGHSLTDDVPWSIRG